MIISIAVLVVLASIAIFMRVCVRIITKVGFKTDDYLIFAAWVWLNAVALMENPSSVDIRTDSCLGRVCVRVLRYDTEFSISRLKNV